MQATEEPKPRDIERERRDLMALVDASMPPAIADAVRNALATAQAATDGPMQIVTSHEGSHAYP